MVLMHQPAPLMPTAKPRITVTLEPHSHEVLSRLSRLGGDSMSALVAQYVELAIPSLERLVVAMERVHEAPQEIRQGFAAAVAEAERDVMPALEQAARQADLFLSRAEASASTAAVGAQPSKAVRRRPAARARAVRTPGQ